MPQTAPTQPDPTAPFRAFLDRLCATESFRRLLSGLSGAGPVVAAGLPGASAALVAAYAALERGGPVLLVAPTDEEAERAQRDAAWVLERVTGLRAWTSRPGETPELDRAVFAERCQTQAALYEQQPLLVVASVRALLTGVPPGAAVTAADLVLSQGLTLDVDSFLGRLVELGMEPAYQVEFPGSYARRGGILDLWPVAAKYPVRLELMGNEVESLRRFDPGSQRTLEPLGSVSLALPSMDPASWKPLLSDLPPRVLVAFLSPYRVREKAVEGVRLQEGRADILDPDEALEPAAGAPVLEISQLPDPTGASVDFGLGPGHRVGGNMKRVLEGLEVLASSHQGVLLVSPLPAERERLAELLPEKNLADRVTVADGDVSGGFVLDGTLLIAAHELFDRYEVTRKGRKATAGLLPGQPIDSFLDLAPGDFVVHVSHGIGRFVEVRSIEKGGRVQEYLVLEYAETVQLYVPLSRLDLVQKYVGAGNVEPHLSRLGGGEWEKKKEQVRKAVQDMAADLLDVQARRQTRPGISYPPDTGWQHEFESAFPYEETPDQTKAIEETKDDMEKPRPMDRLVCGDVGYGKTEVAMRAAFKAVMAGRQAAVLVPTTVLAQQHHTTFSERMADFPVTVEVISRFRSDKEIRDVLERARKGGVDILIGTHRLLSKDVEFKDLGLVVVDEEQRFGVTHKERLKRMRATVDVLTLTATPIPRTLHMALLGIKDISSLTTAPAGRMSIETHVENFDENLIRKWILRELARDGQVYFVHNRVHDILDVAGRLLRVVPEARYAVIHGQMPADDLEDAMERFLKREVDVLVTTTIIESGLDIRNVNTIIVNEADMYGLADLHQLRGRVGRYKHRAYALFLLPTHRPMVHNAEQRIRAIEEFSELGAGFRIAMRDLEIRGAGNILGAEQSGHIAAVGYDLYCRLLAQAVEEAKQGRAFELPEVDVDLDLDLSASIPPDYVQDLPTKLALYRRISHSPDEGALEELRREMADRFGPLPGEVEALIEKTRLRVRARNAGIGAISIHRGEVKLVCRERERAQFALAGLDRPVRVLDERTLVVDFGGRMPFPEEVLMMLNHALGADAARATPQKLEAARNKK